MADIKTKEGSITRVEEYDAHQVAIRTLHKIKAARRGRRYRMIRVDHQTWREVEITNNQSHEQTTERV